MRWPDRDGFRTRPWTFAVERCASPGAAATLDGAELEAGGDEAPVKFTGGGRALARRRSRACRSSLESRQIDLDRPFTQPAESQRRLPSAPVAGGGSRPSGRPDGRAAAAHAAHRDA